MNSQHPHSLGFDSNLVPTSIFYYFQPYLGEDSEYSEQSERFTCISAFSFGNNLNNWEIHLTGSIFLQDTAGSTTNTEYIDYLLDLERKTRIIGKFIKKSSEMAKIAISAQEISETSEQSYFCMLIEKIN